MSPANSLQVWWDLNHGVRQAVRKKEYWKQDLNVLVKDCTRYGWEEYQAPSKAGKASNSHLAFSQWPVLLESPQNRHYKGSWQSEKSLNGTLQTFLTTYCYVGSCHKCNSQILKPVPAQRRSYDAAGRCLGHCFSGPGRRHYKVSKVLWWKEYWSFREATKWVVLPWCNL